MLLFRSVSYSWHGQSSIELRVNIFSTHVYNSILVTCMNTQTKLFQSAFWLFFTDFKSILEPVNVCEKDLIMNASEEFEIYRA